MKTDWIYNFELDAEKHFGFIYLITNSVTGMKYIGKKGFKTKGKHWKNYTSCCKILNADIKLLGKEKFVFEIIELCDSKESLSNREYDLHTKHDVLYRSENGTKSYYNRNIRGEKFDMTGVTMSEETKNKKGLYGTTNHMYDSTVYSFVHNATHETFIGTQSEFQKHTGIISADCVSLIKERQYTCKGWKLSSNKDRLHATADKTIYKFKHKDGNKIESTRIEFQKINNFNNIEVGQLIYGKRKTTKGWSLDL
jgi:hypothetical protein